jgi:ATP-dependent Clp protease, protease subunit
VHWKFWQRREDPARQPTPPPAPLELAGKGSASYEIFSRLLKERIVFIGTPIDDTIANLVAAQLLFLQNEDPRADITLYLNSPGGSVAASLAIYDTMQFVKNDVATYCIGRVAGTATLLMCAGRKGKRFGLSHSRFAFADIWHEPKDTDEERREQEVEFDRLKKALVEAFVERTGKSHSFIESQFGPDRSFGTDEALQLGLIDKVIDAVP